MFESVQSLIAEHKAVQEELSDPAVHADAGRAKRVNRRYAELSSSSETPWEPLMLAVDVKGGTVRDHTEGSTVWP